jgi:hypothetical protein
MTRLRPIAEHDGSAEPVLLRNANGWSVSSWEVKFVRWYPWPNGCEIENPIEFIKISDLEKLLRDGEEKP